MFDPRNILLFNFQYRDVYHNIKSHLILKPGTKLARIGNIVNVTIMKNDSSFGL
jgi:hypothetical protein